MAPIIRHRPGVLLAGVLSMLLSASVAAAPKEETKAEARPDPDKRVCRSVKVTGSQIRQRVCHTQREWDRMREQSQESLNRANSRVTSPDPQ